MLILKLLMPLVGGALYRYRGMPNQVIPKPALQIALALPYALIAAQGDWLLGISVLIITTAALLTGHGNFMDLGTSKHGLKDEKVEFIIKKLYGKIPEFWYDALGLALTGLIVTLPAGLAALNPLLAISGVLKAPAYVIGYGLHRHKFTEIGEFLTGFFLWGALAFFI